MKDGINKFRGQCCGDIRVMVLSSGSRADSANPFLYTETSQIVNIFDFTGHMVPVAISQLCLCSTKAAINSMSTHGHSYVPIKLYMQFIMKFEYHIILISHEILFYFLTSYKKF